MAVSSVHTALSALRAPRLILTRLAAALSMSLLALVTLVTLAPARAAAAQDTAPTGAQSSDQSTGQSSSAQDSSPSNNSSSSPAGAPLTGGQNYGQNYGQNNSQSTGHSNSPSNNQSSSPSASQSNSQSSSAASVPGPEANSASASAQSAAAAVSADHPAAISNPGGPPSASPGPTQSTGHEPGSGPHADPGTLQNPGPRTDPPTDPNAQQSTRQNTSRSTEPSAAAASSEAGTVADSGTRAAARLIERGERALRSDPEASRRDAQGALRLLERTPDPDLEVRAHLLLCDYESERDSSAAGLEAAAALALLPKVERAGLRAGVMICQGAIQETAGDSGKALEHYRDAVTLAARVNDEDMLGEARYQLGYLLGARGDYANGLAQLRQAERLFEKRAKPLHRLAALNSIAILYDRIGEYAEARQIYERALPTQAAEGMQRDQAVTLSNLGRADENLHDWPAAQEAYTQSLALSTQIDYARAQGYALRGLAAVANATGSPAEALTTLSQADQRLAETPDARLHALVELQRGIALHGLKRLKESAASLEEAARIFAQADARPELADTLSAAASVYADSGSWHAAYARQTRAKALSEELLRNQINARFAALKVEFDTAAREKEVAVLTRENQASTRALAQERRDRQLQLAVIGLMVLVALLAGVLALLQLRATRRLRVLAMTDELTRIPNRRAVLRRLDEILSSSDLPTAILILDIDHFKSINDQHGHPAGDEVLKGIAQALQGALRPPACFGRLGGEEFLIVLPATDLLTARAAAERLRERVAGTPLLRSPEERRLTVSIGVAVSKPRSEPPKDLLRRADRALYAAKGGGRNCVMS